MAGYFNPGNTSRREGKSELSEELLQEIRRYLASLKPDQPISSLAYAMAIEPGSGCTTRELQQVIRREAQELGVVCT